MPVTVMQILWGFVLPGVLVVLLGVGVSRFAKDAWWILGVGVGVGFGIAYWNLEPRVAWPPGGNVVSFFVLSADFVGGVGGGGWDSEAANVGSGGV